MHYERHYSIKQTIKPESITILLIYVFFGLLEASQTGFIRKAGATRDDAVVEASMLVLLTAVIQPSVIFLSAHLVSIFAPQLEGILAGIPFVAGFALLLICDDLVNYLWHRNAHRQPKFYKLHRPHHEGEYMSVRIVFRNGCFYFLLAPYYWIGGALLFMGLGWVYAFFIVLKALITFACHSDVCWDKPLYENKWTSPVMWLVERIIVTPSFHHAHHGKHMSDGITHYKGNYGNLLSLWDVLFRTAHITRQYPQQYGIEDLPPTTVGEQLFWPLIKTSPPIVKVKLD